MRRTRLSISETQTGRSTNPPASTPRRQALCPHMLFHSLAAFGRGSRIAVTSSGGRWGKLGRNVQVLYELCYQLERTIARRIEERG